MVRSSLEEGSAEARADRRSLAALGAGGRGLCSGKRRRGVGQRRGRCAQQLTPTGLGQVVHGPGRPLLCGKRTRYQYGVCERSRRSNHRGAGRQAG